MLVLNTEHFTSEHFLVRYPWSTLRRGYGPVLPTVASSLTDFHVRRSDAIRAPGLAWAATSMIAAGYQSISSCQWQRQPALQAGKARLQVGLRFRRDSSGHASVEPFPRRVNLEHSLFGRLDSVFTVSNLKKAPGTLKRSVAPKHLRVPRSLARQLIKNA